MAASPAFVFPLHSLAPTHTRANATATVRIGVGLFSTLETLLSVSSGCGHALWFDKDNSEKSRSLVTYLLDYSESLQKEEEAILDTVFHDRNLDARPPSDPRDRAPLLLRRARVRLNVGSGSAGPAHLADHIGAVAQRSSLLQTVKF